MIPILNKPLKLTIFIAALLMTFQPISAFASADNIANKTQVSKSKSLNPVQKITDSITVNMNYLSLDEFQAMSSFPKKLSQFNSLETLRTAVCGCHCCRCGTHSDRYITSALMTAW